MNTELKAAGHSRRGFLTLVGQGVVLSATAVALLGGREALASKRSDADSADVAILNVALALEHEGIAAYQIGAGSGLLSPDVLAVAGKFMGDHQAHRDALAQTIVRLGGTPVAALSMPEYTRSAKLAISSISSATDVLKLAQRLELGAVNAYLGVIPAFADRELAKVAGRLAADETMHYTALTQALGGALPGAFSYGA